MSQNLFSDEDKNVLYRTWMELNQLENTNFKTNRNINSFTYDELMRDVNSLLAKRRKET
jgi:hypothetical protein